jgi:hypothetical protein
VRSGGANVAVHLLTTTDPAAAFGTDVILGVFMKNRLIRIGLLAAVVGVLAVAAACASLETPNNATTQTLGGISDMASVVAPVVAAVVPAPWGQVVAAVLGAIGVIAGIVAHSVTSRASAQQVVGAVTTGLQAAGQSLGSLPVGGKSPAV